MQGNRLEECLEVLGRAVSEARRGAGPRLVVGSLLRLCGHGEHDDAGYVDPVLKTSDLGADCLKLAESMLTSRGWADAQSLKEWFREATDEVDRAVAQVQREPGPDPYKEDWCALASRHLSEGSTST